MTAPKRKTFSFDGSVVRAGEMADLKLQVSERYTGDPITLPVRVIRARRPGPAVFVTAAIHGDELNGVGVVHELMSDDTLRLKAGTLILVPVVNILGFENQLRYMPDRRDLNRSFPGSNAGSLTGRVARTVFDTLVKRCDYGIDLHTAAAGRTNFPNVRGDLGVPEVRRIAKAFGCELMVHGKGPDGAFRREAVRAGCATIILEAGEPLKIEPGCLEVGLRGVRNVLIELGMLDGTPRRPAYQTRIDKSVWVRANVGGLVRFHVAPGEVVAAGQPIATNASVIGRERDVLTAPVAGVVLGMTTLPMAKPGEPICHLAVLKPGTLKKIARTVDNLKAASLGQRVRNDLATNIAVSEREAEPAPDAADLA